MEKKEQEQQQQQSEVAAQRILQPIVSATESKEYLLSSIGQELKKFELVQRQAMVYCNSTIVPQAYRGQQNIGNVIIGIDMAKRMGVNPLQVFQNLYIVHGNPGWSSKFLIATFNMCGRFSPISYIEVGKQGTDSWGMKAVTTCKDTGETTTGPTITIGIAKQEGWYDKAGSKWKTIPELMLRYRSAAWLINTVAPEISMGISTADELSDIVDAEYTEIQNDAAPQNAAPARIAFAPAEGQKPVVKEEKKPEAEAPEAESKKGKEPTATDLFGK